MIGNELDHTYDRELRRCAGSFMTRHLPLAVVQPGIQMAEKFPVLPSARNVAHYVELAGEPDALLLAKVVVADLEQADTLRMWFSEDSGEIWQ